MLSINIMEQINHLARKIKKYEDHIVSIKSKIFKTKWHNNILLCECLSSIPDYEMEKHLSTREHNIYIKRRLNNLEHSLYSLYIEKNLLLDNIFFNKSK